MTKFWLVPLLIFMKEIIGVYAYLSPSPKSLRNKVMCTIDGNDPSFISDEGGGGSGANGGYNTN